MNTLTVNASSMSSGPVARRAGAWFANAGAAVWKALQASGQARAGRQLLDLADQCEATQPELARELRAAARHTLMG